MIISGPSDFTRVERLDLKPLSALRSTRSTMNSAMLTTIAATGFTVAFFHAAIPTHWLPFVLVSRARGWSRGKTLAVATLAGLGHVAITSLLGLDSG